MSTQLRRSLMSGLDGLRHEPSPKRIRAALGDRTVVDTTRAMLLWEPRRVVSSWAVPVVDLAAELVPAAAATTVADTEGYALPDISERPVLDPSIPFAVHTAEGDVVDVRVGGQVRAGAGLRLADPDLDGYIVLDFGAFDTWWEEDEVNVGHPREPFHRIDVCSEARGRCGLSSTARCSPSRVGHGCCSRRCCPFASTFPARTFSPSSCRARPVRRARTRATRRTGRLLSAAAR
jgi:hypothetical protein